MTKDELIAKLESLADGDRLVLTPIVTRYEIVKKGDDFEVYQYRTGQRGEAYDYWAQPEGIHGVFTELDLDMPGEDSRMYRERGWLWERDETDLDQFTVRLRRAR